SGPVNAPASADRSRIVEMVATPNGFAVVSEFLAGLTTFPDWLAARAPAPPPGAAPQPAPAAPPPPGPGAPGAPVSPPADAPPARAAAPPEPTQSFVIGRVESSRGGPPKAVQ